MALEDPRDKDTRGQRSSPGRSGPADRGGRSGGAKGPGGKTPSLADTARQVYDAPAGPMQGTGDPMGGSYDPNRGNGVTSSRGEQVYSNPVGPDQSTGDPMGNAEHHFNENTDSTLDSLGGYQTYGDRYNAYQSNPNSPPNRAYDGYVPSYPFATPGYVTGKVLDTIFGALPGVGLTNAAYTGLNGAFTGDFDGMFTDAAESLGASRGPRGPDVRGGGTDRGGGGQAIESNGDTTLASDGNSLNRSPMAQAMETLLEYTSGGTSPVKKQSPLVQQPGVQSPFPSGSSQVVA